MVENEEKRIATDPDVPPTKPEAAEPELWSKDLLTDKTDVATEERNKPMSREMSAILGGLALVLDAAQTLTGTTTEKAKTPYFQEGRKLDDDEKRALGDDVKPELVEAIARRINEVGTDPRTTILEAFKNNRVVGLGETHPAPTNGLRDDGLALIPDMKKAGLTHLAVEIRKAQQPLLDDFLNNKISNHEFKRQFFESSELPPGYGDQWLAIMKSAHEHGIKVVAVDDYKDLNNIEYLGISKEKAEQRDKSMAGMIGDILDKDKDAKVLFWVGSDHLENGIGRYKNETAGELLKQKGKKDGFGVAIFESQLEYHGSGERSGAVIAGTATKPVAFQTEKVPDYSKLPNAPGKKFDNVILYPADYSLRLAEEKYGANDRRVLPLINKTAMAYAGDRSLEKALKLTDRGTELSEKLFGKDSGKYVDSITQTGRVYEHASKRKEANEWYQKAFDAAAKLPKDQQFALLEPAARLEMNALYSRKDRDKAGAHIEKALDYLKDHPDMYKELRKASWQDRREERNAVVATENLIRSFSEELDKPEKALQLSKTLLELDTKTEDVGSWRLTDRNMEIGKISQRLGKKEEAGKHFADAVANAEKGEKDYTYQRALAAFAGFHMDEKQYDKAEPLLTRQLESIEKAKYKSPSELMSVHTKLGQAYVAQGKNDAAEKSFKAALQIADDKKDSAPRLAVQGYAALLRKTGRADEAEALERKYSSRDDERGR